MVEKIKNSFSAKALFRAPLIPSLLFTSLFLVAMVMIAPLAQLLLPEILTGLAANALLQLILIAFVFYYLTGIVYTLVLGVLIYPLLPPEIPVLSAMNRNGIGRVAMIFAVAALSVLVGIPLYVIVFALMCLSDYINGIPRKRKNKEDIAEWAIAAARRIAEKD